MGCIVCDRIARVDRIEVHEPWVVSFEPEDPITAGHRLFVSRMHLVRPDSEPLIAGRVFEEATIYAARRLEDYNLLASSGMSAGQAVMHMYVDYIPRRPGDGLASWFSSG